MRRGVTSGRAALPRARRARRVWAGRTELLWAAATPAVTVLAALLPLLRTRDFYFRDDTEIGAAPLWFHLGERLRDGQWPLLDVHTWMAGNLAAEGQWGLWSPITLGISYLSGLTDGVLVFSTAVKLLFLAVAALGTYLLARTYDVRPPLAFVAGAAVPLNGFTLYMDAPSWVTGLMTWALLPYAWAFLRRSTALGTNPWLFFVFAYLIVTIGYFHGFLALGVVIVAVGVDRLCLRDWRAVRTVVVAGVFCLLLAVTVYLPAVLTAEVTERDETAVANDSWLTGELGGLLAGFSPTGMARIDGWWGTSTTTPLMFVAWFLPVLVFIAWSRVRPQLRQLRDVAVVGGVALLVAIGPSGLGPLRFPVRVMPYVALTLVLAVVVLLDRSLPVRPTRTQLAWATAWVAGGSFLGYAEQPEQYALVSVVTALLLAGGVALVWLLLRRVGRDDGRPVVPVVALVLAAGVVLGTGSQVWLFPQSPLSDYDMPGRLADYRTQLPEAVNDVIVVGGGVVGVPERPESRFDHERKPVRPGEQSAHWREMLVGNAWLLNDARVQNTYSVLEHEAYREAVCTNNRGETCQRLIRTLFRTQPGVYEPLVDLLSIDTLLILKGHIPAPDRRRPPAGWSVARDGLTTVTWVRDEPVGPAGGVVWTSEGTSVAELDRTDRTVKVRVDEVGADGGRVVFSRLAWPGYSVDGATLAPPLNEYLLQVELPPGSAGEVVAVHFSPPGWAVCIASWVAALLLAVGWSVGHAVLRARRRRLLSADGVAAETRYPPAMAGQA